MAIIMCDKGHYYDDSNFFQCPYCGISFEFTQEEIEEDIDDVTVKLAEMNLNYDEKISF